jgi:hypothetical protein
MRYVNLDRLRGRIPAEWKAKAKEISEELAAAATPEERADIIERNAGIWKELKELLAEEMGGKCWYCESKQFRSDNPIDHYRPKGRVIECADHPGYWWKAFDWENYRFSCTYCNSRRKDIVAGRTGGKHDHFPLAVEANRVFFHTDDLRRESPLLLDPSNAGDIPLLWFEHGGHATAKYGEDEYPLLWKRATCSIALYHLNHTRLQELRQELINFLRRRIEEGEYFFRKSASGDEAAREGFRSVLSDLLASVTEHAEYSSTAHATLAIASKTYRWLESVI